MPQNPFIAGRYEVLAEIGRGGMGLVLRAFDHRLQTEVAIKVLRHDLAKDSGDRDSLVKEARVLARLTHTSIVRLFDLAETESGLMLILEFVKGPNLAQVLERRRRLTETEVLHLARQICDGLSAAHSEGVVHRDLKPPNLLVAPGPMFADGADCVLDARVKITDFGISKLLATRLSATNGGGAAAGYTDATLSAAGTPLYMAPEQFRGEPCSPATDTYALGVILYQMLSGAPPFFASEVVQLAYQHFRVAPAPLAECSPALNAVLLRALEKEPVNRFSSARDLLMALESAILAPSTGSARQAPPQPPPPPPPKQDSIPFVPQIEVPPLEPDALDKAASWLGKRWWIGMLAAMAVIAVGIGLLFTQKLNRSVPAAGGVYVDTSEEPDFGRTIELPVDLDQVPQVREAPPRSATPAPITVTAGTGPLTRPHAVWTAFVEMPSSISGFMADASTPDGTVYVRSDDVHGSGLWVVNDQGFRWGYRPSPPAQYSLAAWPDHSRIDLRDPGRVWMTSCTPNRGSGCSSVVFNYEGRGGWISRAAAEVTAPAPDPAPESTAFSGGDVQTGRWPEDRAVLDYTSRLGKVTLHSTGGWTLPVEGKPTQAVAAPGQNGGGWIVSTSANRVYSINPNGTVNWSFEAGEEVHALKVLPGGDLLVFSGEHHRHLLCLRGGQLRWRLESRGWIRDYGVTVDTSGNLFVVAFAGRNVVVHALTPDGKALWMLDWKGVSTSSEHLLLGDRGRLYLSNLRVERNGKWYNAVTCLTTGN